jgi:hypothetical protein
MRRSRRGGFSSGPEFGGSGEDSFVAVVVTKLTGALLFILLLTMVIMALLPKAVDAPRPDTASATSPEPLAIATPEALPEAIVGRPYAVALAATGGRGPLRWAVDGPLPDGLRFDRPSAQIQGTPRVATSKPVELTLRVSDGSDRAGRLARLVVYEPDRPLTTPSVWKPKLPPVPWRAWMEQGFGFLVLLLVHSVGMNALGGVQRWSSGGDTGLAEDAQRALHRRFLAYRTVVRLATLSAVIGLGVWLWSHRG